MEAPVSSVVERLHQTPHKAVVYATGGGSQAGPALRLRSIPSGWRRRVTATATAAAVPAHPGRRPPQALSWLLSVPGASNTVLEASVPYSRGSLIDILGSEPAQYCCQETAVLMAKAAYRRAANLTPIGTPVVGVAATCALATDRPKRGDHHAHLAAHTGLKTYVFDLALAKGGPRPLAPPAHCPLAHLPAACCTSPGARPAERPEQCRCCCAKPRTCCAKPRTHLGVRYKRS
jgi:hypothetical protein